MPSQQSARQASQQHSQQTSWQEGQQTPQTREIVALALLSATLLAYQVWLTRMIAIQHWHHLAALIIALALLGFGAAGVLVALRADSVRHHYRTWLLAAALGTAVSLVAGLLLAIRLPLNMLALPWQWQQIAWLVLYGLCFVPVFLAGAIFVTVCFVRWPQRGGRIYGVDLLAGAVGALLILPLIQWLGLLPALWLLLLLPLLAAALLGSGSRTGLSLTLLTSALALAGLAGVQITPAEYKAVSQRMLERDSRVVLQRDGLSQRLAVLDTPGMHDAPGLSLSSRAHAPRQWQLFSNGDSAVPLLLPPRPEAGFYRQLLGYAPYALKPQVNSVLLLEVDSLWHSWLAQAAAVRQQQLICADGAVIELLQELKRQQVDGIFPAQLQLRQSSARRFMAQHGADYDLITLVVASPEAGMAATQENYLLTLQGLGAAFDRLSGDGMLAIDLQLHSLPREMLKLVASLVEVLQQRQLPTEDHLVIVRDWRNALLLVSRSAFTSTALAGLRQWSLEQQFDLVALPGLLAQDSNRFHQLSEDYFGPVQALLNRKLDSAAAELKPGSQLELEPRLDLQPHLKLTLPLKLALPVELQPPLELQPPVELQPQFELTPATDDRPFFFRFMRWQSLRHWLTGSGGFWRSHLDWGYLLAIAALAAGTLLAIGLLLLPVRWRRRGSRLSGWAVPGWAMIYFSAIGAGFMLVEIGLLQQATLLLDATALSMSAVLAAMLVGAGAGSLLQQRWQPPDRIIQGLLLLVAALAIAALPLLRTLFDLAAAWSLWWRLPAVAVPMLLLALPMGFALPHALARLTSAAMGSAAPATIAWVWALNGFTSVLGALAASLIAVHAGLSILMLVAATCYLTAALALMWGK